MMTMAANRADNHVGGPQRDPRRAAFEGIRLTWRLYRDPRVSPRLKVVLPIIAVLYVLSPIDAVPDLLVGLGQVDDLAVVALLVSLLVTALRLAPAEVVAEHLTTLRGDRRRGNPRGDVIDAPYRVTGPTRRENDAQSPDERK